MPPDFVKNVKEINFGGEKWLLLVDDPIDGQTNMDRDRELLKWAYSDDDAVPVLRFFLWNPPTVSIGFGQPMEQIDAQKCAERKIPIVRRPTGGRAIYHHNEFTYSVTLPPSHKLSQLNVLGTYNELSRALALGLRNLDIPAKLSRGEPGAYSKNPSCFSSTSRYELVVNGKKLVGSAQRRRHKAVLQQGSIMAGSQYKLLAEIVSENGDAIRKELDHHSTYIEEILGEIPKYDDFIDAMISGFEKAFE